MATITWPTSQDAALKSNWRNDTSHSDGTTDGSDAAEGTHAAEHNKLALFMAAAELEMGNNPSGTFADIAARLNARQTCRKTADQTNATTTLANVTDLVLPVTAAGLDYTFRFFVVWKSNTAGVTAQFAVTTPGVVGYVAYWGEVLGAGTTVPSTGGINVVFDQIQAASGAVIAGAGGSAAAPPTANAINIARIEGILSNPNAAGSIQLQAKAETTGTITISRGSFGEIYIN